MKEASYVDSEGRQIAVWVPEGVPATSASLGIHRGPPPLDGMGLPLDLEVRLNNELFKRGCFEWADVQRNRDLLVQALRVVLNLSAERLLALYLESSSANADNQKMSEPGRSRKRIAAPTGRSGGGKE